MSDLAPQLVGEEEGRSRTVYPDTRGIQTIAIGCVVDPKVPGAGLCDAAIMAQFEHDAAQARAIAATWPHADEVSDIRRAVFVSMAFQLGDKPHHWPNFMAALANRDYKSAATAGRDSEWWRTQTPKRAEREMRMLETDTWIPRT